MRERERDRKKERFVCAWHRELLYITWGRGWSRTVHLPFSLKIHALTLPGLPPIAPHRKDSTIWKRSFARMKERAGEDYNDEQDVDDSHHGASLAPAGKVGSLVAWSRRNPLLFAVYLLIFGHAAYRIALILTSPVGLPP